MVKPSWTIHTADLGGPCRKRLKCGSSNAQDDWTQPFGNSSTVDPGWAKPFGNSSSSGCCSSGNHIQEVLPWQVECVSGVTSTSVVPWSAEGVSGCAVRVRQSWQQPHGGKRNQSRRHALAPARAWTQLEGCSPPSDTPAGEATAPSMSFSSSALLLAGGSQAGNHSKYAENGKSVLRMQCLLKEGCCECARNCHKQVTLAIIRNMCNLYWNLTSEEQSYLAAPSAFYPVAISMQSTAGKAQFARTNVPSTALLPPRITRLVIPKMQPAPSDRGASRASRCAAAPFATCWASARSASSNSSMATLICGGTSQDVQLY